MLPLSSADFGKGVLKERMVLWVTEGPAQALAQGYYVWDAGGNVANSLMNGHQITSAYELHQTATGFKFC